jgi:hypothetical protein
MITMYLVPAYIRGPFAERVHNTVESCQRQRKKESLLPESES